MKFKILVVEDEVDYRDVLVDFLNLKGYQSFGIGTINDYRNLDNKESYNLIVLDRTLPDGDGLEILRGFRQHSDIPVVILSCLGSDEDRVQGLEADANYYLVKPVKTPELLAIISHYERRIGLPNLKSLNWYINPKKWMLIPPDGTQIKLTHMEMDFLMCFVKNQGAAISRDQIVLGLGYRPEVYDPRRLLTIVSRLRHKIKDSGIEDFPLANVYGEGYVFNAGLIYAANSGA